MHDVIGCEDMCADRLCKKMGCKMNNKQGVTNVYSIGNSKVREELDNDLEQFVLS